MRLSAAGNGEKMLDKTIPYAGIYMRRKAGMPIPDHPLPDGFRFSFFDGGDEESWARIEVSVLEFSSEFAAILHFKKEFIPFLDELKRRCIFIENSEGEKIATSMAWWSLINGERRPWLHWVAVVPEYQDLGLGKAIVSRVAALMVELEGDVDLFLSTQTWSYKAIGIYKDHGFEPTDEPALYRNKGDNYKKAMRILKRLKRK